MKKKFNFIFIPALLLLLAALASAQQPPAEPKIIQDNSFLLEEAYNQEAGIVQHISNFIRLGAGDWAYAFTQEWPLPGHERHQLSYTLVANSSPDFDRAGFGDTALNYRYQLVGNGASRVAFSPRVSLLVPTGATRFGRGYGGTGVQFGLPASIVLNRRFTTHWNVGGTVIHNARNEFGDRAMVSGYNLGQSVIFQAHPRFNLMVETVWAGNESVVARGQTQRSHDFYVSPGVRWAYNLKARDLQIVPGIAFPQGVGPSAGTRGIILYLSFEHVMWRDKPKVAELNGRD